MTKYPAKNDIAVLLLFFTRSDTFQQVFNEVRKARPSRLFLFQDGPRGERDMAGIEACRQIVSDDQIDWECEVHRNYQEQNLGCEPAEYYAQKWAFSLADKCIVLEDDDVPSQSFFPFCKEMLDKYEYDERITLISGFNMDEVTADIPYDYFFTSAFSIWGWASWRRVIDQWDEHYTFLDDSYNLGLLKSLIKQRNYSSDILKMAYDRKKDGKPYYESIFWTSMLFNSGLAIMPAKNMIRNIGATENSTNYSAFDTMPHGLKRIFTMKSYDIDFPLHHPAYVIEDVNYIRRMYRYNAWGHPWIKVGRSIEELFLNLRHGNFKHIRKSVVRRIQKLTGTYNRI